MQCHASTEYQLQQYKLTLMLCVTADNALNKTTSLKLKGKEEAAFYHSEH